MGDGPNMHAKIEPNSNQAPLLPKSMSATTLEDCRGTKRSKRTMPPMDQKDALLMEDAKKRMNEILLRPDPSIVLKDDPIYLAELERLRAARAKAGNKYFQPAEVRKRQISAAKLDAKCKAQSVVYGRSLDQLQECYTNLIEHLSEHDGK